MGAIAFFDMPGSTEIMKRDPRGAIQSMLRHNAMCGAIIESSGGEIVKEIGDGIMAMFDNAGVAVGCAIRVIQCLRDHGGGTRTKAAVAYGTLWRARNPSGAPDVYGTPVHVSARMAEHAVKDTVLIDGNDKGPAVEWLERTGFTVRRTAKRLRSYRGRTTYSISPE